MSNQTNPYQLSGRKKEIIELRADGLTTKEIAHKLQLSRRYVETLIQSVKDEMKCLNQVQLIVLCMQKGLIRQSPLSSENTA